MIKINDLSSVPTNPGVYLWKDQLDNVIYVGKAKNLKNRMSQYFKGSFNSFKTKKMLDNIFSFEYFITSSEKEALILEKNLIEKYSPEYNILLLDDKRYPYIKVSLKEKLTISLMFRIKNERDNSSVYFGPFPSGFGAKKLSNLLSRIFLYDKGLPIKNLPFSQWEKKFLELKSFLSSQSSTLKKFLNKEMQRAAENMQYEIAADIKETIVALNLYDSNQNVELLNKKDLDFISFYFNDNYLSIAFLFYRQGILLSKKEAIIEIVSSTQETIRHFLNQYYLSNYIPQEIYSNIDLNMQNSIIPKKGNMKKIVNMTLMNAKDNFEIKVNEYKHKINSLEKAIFDLQNQIKIKNIKHIMMVDNSNTNNSNPVSAFVSYRNGIKQPSEYRKYILTIVKESRKSDVEYLRQGLLKYFNKETNAKPDLLIVDGGKPQINEAKKIIKNIPIIGLVKDEKHKTRAIISQNLKEEKIISKELYNFLSNIQIEVDRYAKNFHRKKRTTLEGKLISIKGIGPKIEQKLLEHFKTYSKIYNSTIEELSNIVSKDIATRIKKEL